MTELPISFTGADWTCTDDERDLIERAKHDADAFAVLYRRNYAPIAGYIYRRLGDAHETEDLVADVFITAMRSLPRFRYRGVPIKAWLLKIATNAVKRAIKRRYRRRWLQLDDDHADRGATSSTDEDQAAATREALWRLSQRHQTVLSLFYLEGLSVEEVAATTGWRIGTVKSRLARGRVALREELSRGR